MFCNKCGDKVEANETYCNKCGNFLGNSQPAAPQAPATQQATPTPYVAQQRPISQPQQVMQPTMPQVQQVPQQQPQSMQQVPQQTFNNNVNNNDNSQMFVGNARSLNAQMMNMNYNQQMPNNNQTKKKAKSVVLGFVIGAVVFGLLAFVILTTFQDSVYLSDDTYKEETEEKKKGKGTATSGKGNNHKMKPFFVITSSKISYLKNNSFLFLNY